MKTYWTGERIERLKALWADGYSAAQIAKILSTAPRNSVTRSSVLGKVYRLGLGNAHRRTSRTRRAIRGPSSPYKPYNLFESTAYGVAFMDLERHHCRWPVDVQFCGADAVESKPYCSRHLRMAYK